MQPYEFWLVSQFIADHHFDHALHHLGCAFFATLECLLCPFSALWTQEQGHMCAIISAIK
jgi:hypothetical protein